MYERCHIRLLRGDTYRNVFVAPIDMEVDDRFELNYGVPYQSQLRVMKIVRGRRIIYKETRDRVSTPEHFIPSFTIEYPFPTTNEEILGIGFD